MAKDHAPLYRVVILGAGKGFKGTGPSAIMPTDSGHRVLDWLLDAFSSLPGAEIDFVAGYKAQDIRRRYPKIHYFHNPQWESTGPVRSLAVAELTARRALYVCYADMVFRRDIVRRMEKEKAGCVVAADTLWQGRYEAHSREDMGTREKLSLRKGRLSDIGVQLSPEKADAQFTGLMRVSASALPALRRLVGGGKLDPGAKLSALVRSLKKRRISTRIVDLKGDWAELDAPQDLARFVLGTKAESLERLRPLVRKSRIGRQVAFTYGDWQSRPARFIARIQKTFKSRSLIVRSSALDEDRWQQSAAGAHQSVADVPAADAGKLAGAVRDVFSSYGTARREDQVLVQEMISDPAVSGVVMTRTPASGAPYYIFNFDDASRRTDTVTSGTGSELRTVTVYRAAPARYWPVECLKLRAAVMEIERLVGHDALNIEFAAASGGRVHILQVRPIAASWRQARVSDGRISAGIAAAQEQVASLAGRRPFLAGSSTALSVMSDWNPAEMIGTKPNRLALSLYRYLITDETWAQQRAQYGYRDVRPHALMTEVAGHPYIDLRVDFNSFIPAVLPGAMAGDLVNYYLSRLKAAPHLHDKVEFDILLTALSFDTGARLRELKGAGFTAGSLRLLRRALLDITRNGIARCPLDISAIRMLPARYEAIMSCRLPALERAQALLADARNIGVLHFSHLARNAFVAMGFLKSLSAAAIADREEVDAFLASLNTVSGLMRADAARVARRQMAWADFVGVYGHLRPGTYDITSPCYADAPREFLRPMVNSVRAGGGPPGKSGFSPAARAAVGRALKREGLGIGAAEFERFARTAIEGRESGKFIFTRSLNAALKAVAQFGAGHGIAPEEMAHVRWEALGNLRGEDAASRKAALLRLIEEGKEAYQRTQAVCLPDLIFERRDLKCMEHPRARPNFVTHKKVRGPAVTLTGRAVSDDLRGRIVVVEKADPGLDWIFGRGIAGFVTMYGGVNSHMAIRAAELQLPAAIGVGEALFLRLQRAAVVELDCAGQRIIIVR